MCMSGRKIWSGLKNVAESLPGRLTGAKERVDPLPAMAAPPQLADQIVPDATEYAAGRVRRGMQRLNATGPQGLTGPATTTQGNRAGGLPL
jgi:hypothetical protein